MRALALSACATAAPTHSATAAAPATAPLKAPAAASPGPVVKGLTLAPSRGGASQTWKSRRAKYSHLPPITVTLYHANQRAEVRVDERTRCGDLMRDLLAGGPSDGLLERLQEMHIYIYTSMYTISFTICTDINININHNIIINNNRSAASTWRRCRRA